MKIKEIIELSKTYSLAEIAKEHLKVGKEKAREGLKKAGCYSKNGVKGWHFNGEESVLEQSIYDFVTTTRKSKPSPNVSTKERKNESSKQLKKEGLNQRTKEPSNVVTEGTKEQIAKAKQEVAVTKELSNVPTKQRTKQPTNEGKNEGSKQPNNERSNVVRKRSSFDLDVEVMKELKVQAVLHDRNVYEIVETAIKQYLRDLK